MGRVIRDLFRLLRAVTLLHGTAALIYSNYPREAATSTCMAIISGWIARDFSLVPSFNSGPNATPASAQALPVHALPVQCHCQCIIIVNVGLMLAIVALNNRQYSVWHKVSRVGWIELPQILLLYPRLSDPKIAEPCWTKKWISGRLGMPGGKYSRHAQNPWSGEWWENTLNNPPCPITPFSCHHLVASELKDPIWHSSEWQIGSFSSEATICTSCMSSIIALLLSYYNVIHVKWPLVP